MVIIQSRSRRKPTGGRLKDYRKKRLFETGNEPILPKVGESKVKTLRTRGGNSTIKGYSFEFVNVADKSKVKKAKILNVTENPANRHFVRRNILTKGTIVETDEGKVRITSSPGKQGVVNGVLVK